MPSMVELVGKRCFVHKKTHQLSACEKLDFLGLFRRTFHKTMTLSQFERKYSSTALGYSHHGLMFADGILAGTYNIIPYVYSYFGTRRLFGLCTDTMVAPAHRGGPFNVLKMAGPVHQAAAQDDIGFLLDFPNESAAGFTRKILRWTEIGELDFYALPLTIGTICPALRWADFAVRLCSRVIVRLPGKKPSSEASFPVEKMADEPFATHRYGPEHHTLNLCHGGDCVYRLYQESNGARVVYLIDVRPLTARHFAKAIRMVHAATAGRADFILYVGRLPFRPAGLLRVSPSRRPRRIVMCGKILNGQLIDDRVFQIANWNINLSNFDVR